MRSSIAVSNEKHGFPAWLLVNSLFVLSEVVAVAFFLTSCLGALSWSQGIGWLAVLYLALASPFIAIFCWIAAEKIDREMDHPTLRKIFLTSNHLGMGIGVIASLGWFVGFLWWTASLIPLWR